MRFREPAAGRQGHARRRGRQAHHHRFGDRFRGQEGLGGDAGSPGIWRTRDPKAGDKDKINPLDKTWPFPADWRQGTAVIYPINRIKETPLDACTVVDVMRNTLGVGPCQQLLDLEGQRAEYKGTATCYVRDHLTPIYEKKQQKEKRAEVDKTLDDGLTFVKHIRRRIKGYVEFGHKMRDYLAEQKKAHPELAKAITEMEKINAGDRQASGSAQPQIKTPEHVAKMNEDFRKNVLDYEGPDALQRCKAYGDALVEIGGNQDDLVRECNRAVKVLRQRAGILMTLDPRLTPIAPGNPRTHAAGTAQPVLPRNVHNARATSVG